MSRIGLALLALLAVSQVASTFAVEDPNFFESSAQIWDKFMTDLTDSWTGLYKKHHPTGPHTGPTGPFSHGLFKKGRLPLTLSKAFGYTGPLTGLFTGPHLFTGAHAVLNKVVDEQVQTADSVKSFFQDALSTIKERIDESSKDFIAAAEARGEKIDKLSSEFKDRVSIAYENTMMTADEFLSGILGKNYKDYFPKGMDMSNWSKLGSFKFEGTMADMIDLLNFDDVHSPKDLYDQLSKSDKLICTPEVVKESKKVPTTCTGPIVSLELRPKVCTIDPIHHVLTCDPAKLVLVKTPGVCIHKYHKAFSYKGKECKITASLGVSKEAIIGGGEFSIDFTKTGATVNVPDDQKLVDVSVSK